MSTILHLDSSPLGEASITRRLSREFVEKWKQANPNGEIVRRDLATTNLPGIDGEWVKAIHTPADALSDGQREALKLSDTLIAELERADTWAFGVPMHNFSVPATFKLWLDQVARAGKTFTYASGVPEGLLKNKKAHFFLASGGVYDASSPAASYDFVQPYLRTIFGFLGVTDTCFHSAGGAAALNYGKIDRETFLEPHLEAIRAEFQAA